MRASNTQAPPSSSSSSSNSEQSNVNPTADTSIPLSDALQIGGLYILRGDRATSQPRTSFLTADDHYPRNDSGSWVSLGSSFSDMVVEDLPYNEYLFATATSDFDGDIKPYIPLDTNQNDQLIAIGEHAPTCSIYKITKEGYWTGFSFEISSSEHSEYPVGNITFNGEDADVAEINGANVTNSNVGNGQESAGDIALQTLASSDIAYDELLLGDLEHHRYIVSSNQPNQSFVLGLYQGSSFDEATVRLDEYYYFATYIKTNVERTKGGYCVIDLESLDPGHYLACLEISENEQLLAFEII